MFLFGINQPTQGVHAKLQLRFLQLLNLQLKQGAFVQQALSHLLQEKALQKLKLATLLHQINNGLRLSQTLAKNRLLDDYLIRLIDAGERINQLSDTLIFCEQSLATQLKWKQSLQQLLIYPVLMVLLVSFCLIIASSWLAPQLEALKSQISLAWTSRLLLGLAAIPWYYWLASGALSVLVLLVFQAKLKQLMSHRIHRLGLLGRVVWYRELSKLCYQMSASQGIRLGFIESIQLAEQVVQLSSLRQFCRRWVSEIYQGQTIFYTPQHSPYFPNHLLSIVQFSRGASEQSRSWKFVAQSLEQEADQMVNQIKPLIEPSVIVMMGLLIAFFIHAIVLPLYQNASW